MAEIPVTGYIPPGAYTFRDPLLGTATLVGGQRIPAFMGKTFGALTRITDESVTKGAIGGTDGLAQTAESVITVALVAGGANVYLNGVDFLVTSGDIDWSPNTVLSPPTGFTGTAADLGGMLVGGAYSYVVTARKKINLTGPVYGETVQTGAVSVTVGGSASGKVTLSWDAVPLADEYRIYRLVGTTYQLLATVTAPTTTYVDNGSATPSGSISPPASNNAYRQPAVGQAYFVTYEYRLLTFFAVEIFTSVSTVLERHGAGSELAIAAELALAQPPSGQGCPAVMLVAIPDSSNASYITAMDKLKFQLPAFVIPLSSNEALNLLVTQHVDTMSGFRQKRERTTVLAPPVTKSDGNATTDTDIRNMAEALNFTNDFGAPAGRRVLFLSETQVRVGNVLQSDGTRADTTLSGAFLAAAVAARYASLPDTATPGTAKTIFNSAILSQRDEASKDLLATDGVCVVHDPGNGLATIRQQLTAASINSGALLQDQEYSIILADDFLAQNLRIGWQKFIGQKFTTRLANAIKGSTIRTLGNLKKQEIIFDFDQNSVEVRQSTVNPTFILVNFKYFEIDPVNAVIGQYGYDTQVG